jgi:hypothetical protein
METEFTFYGDPVLLEDIEKFFISQGLKAKHEVVIRASEPKPGDKRRATSDLIRIFESIERLAIAYLAFLDGKSTKVKLKFKSGDDSVEVIKGDMPDKVSRFVQKHKGGFFEIDLTL